MRSKFGLQSGKDSSRAVLMELVVDNSFVLRVAQCRSSKHVVRALSQGGRAMCES
jgi:hypothetical protein